MVLGRIESFAGTYVMPFQVRLGSLGGTVFFQVGLCTSLETMMCLLFLYKELHATIDFLH